MEYSSHICVGSVDCSVTVYDLTNGEACGRYVDMTAVPMSIEVVYTKKLDRRKQLNFDKPASGTPEKEKVKTDGETVSSFSSVSVYVSH